MSPLPTPAAAAGAPTGAAFFLSTQHKHHLVQYAMGSKQALGRMAFVPALPNLRFVYREEWGGHDAGAILTEEYTGLAFAKAPTRKALHKEVQRLLKKHGKAGALSCLSQWAKHLGVPLPYELNA